MTRRQVAKSVSSTLPTATMPAALTRPSRRPALLLDGGDHAQPVGFRGDVERVIDAPAPGKVASDGDAALFSHRAGDRRPDRAGRAGHQYDLVLEPGHGSGRSGIV